MYELNEKQGKLRQAALVSSILMKMFNSTWLN